MANWYVAKDGNDGNSGASWALAKLTVGGAVAAAANLDTIYIAGGTYNESVSITGNKTLTFRGVGAVILSGAGLGAVSGFYKGPSLYLYDLSICDFSGGMAIGCNNPYGAVYCYRVHISGCSNGIHSYATGNGGTLWLEDCLCIGNGTGTMVATVYRTPVTILRSSIVNWATCVSLAGASTQGTLSSTILSGATLIASTVVTANSDYNCLDFSGANKTTIDGVNYDTLALHQAGTGLDTNSLDSTPSAELLDTAKGLYALRPTSSLVRRGSGGANIGWGGPAVGISSNINADTWDAFYVRSGAAQINASGNWEIITGPAVIRACDANHNALDLGASRTIRRVRPIALETYPGSVIDYSTADAAPRQLTWRRKYSATQFNVESDADWAEINRDSDWLVSADCRYVSVEATLRQDGV